MPGAFASTPLELPPPSEEDDDDEDEEEASVGWQVAFFFDLCFAKFLRGSLPKFWRYIASRNHWQDATVWEVMMKTQPNQWGKASLSYSSTFSCIQHLGSKALATSRIS